MDDWEELGENVWSDTMMKFHLHDDGRGCSYHSRLQSWVFQTVEFVVDKKCLRTHEGVFNA